MNKGKIIGLLAGLVLCLLWILLYPASGFMNVPIVFLGGWNVGLNFVCLQIYGFYYLNNRLRGCIYLILYALFYGYFGMILSSLARNWVIIPLMLVPFLNVFVYIGTALWIGIIGLGSIATETLLRSSFLSAPFFVVPLIEWLGRAMAIRLKKLELRMIESRIKELEKIIEENKDFLAQRDKLGEEINKIVALDPANLGLKAESFRRQAKSINNEQIRKRITKIDNERQNTEEKRRRVQEKLNALETKKGALEHELQEIKNNFHKLEIVDPANIGIKIQKLRSEWESMNKQDLEKINTTGEIEQLFKEQLLLSFRVEAYDKEIESISKEVIRIRLVENTLELEKLVLQLEEMDRNIEREEPHLLEIQDELERLHMNRDRHRESLESVKS